VTADELLEEISIELELLGAVIGEISTLKQDLMEREPTVREKTAAAAFLAQFYGGVENILKRIHRYQGLQLPTGDTWHTDLFRRYCDPPYGDLPLLFDEKLAVEMAPYRKFRHVVYHGYGFQMDWDRMNEGIEHIADVFSRFKTTLAEYLLTL
jgi:hypothetical protein